MLSGDNSILRKSTDAKEKTGIAQVTENAKLDVLAQIAENKGQNISKDQLKTILNKYFEDIDELELPDDLSNSTIKLNANQANGGYQNIALSDIYNGKFETAEEGISYVIGDYITINGEGFYVIEDSPINQTTVKLLTAKFVNTSTKKQANNANPVIFDNSTNVYANSNIKTEVASYVSSLGIDIVSSGLLSCDDLENLKNETYLVMKNQDEYYMSFWLDSLGCDDGYAWQGGIAWFEGDYTYASYDWGEINEPYYYLRPFIEILKANIPS